MAKPAKRLLGLVLLLPFTSACALFTPSVKLPPLVAHAVWQEATPEQLVAAFNRNAEAIHTLSLTVDLTATPVGGTAYSTITGHLLLVRLASLRIYGELPLVGGKAFDMASSGDEFELNIPSRSQFIVGRNDCVPPEAKNPLERMRPRQILAALPVNPITTDERAVLVDDVMGKYNLVIEDQRPDGALHASRRLVFDRIDLTLEQEVLYDAKGERETVASYSNYATTQDVQFPGTIIIDQPADYRLQLKLQRPPQINDNNPALDDPATFEITPPAGSKVIDAGNCSPAGANGRQPPGE